jgi:cysteine-rich repeat protein
VCDAASPTRKICLHETCQESLCGDGFVDTGGGEECEDGNSVPGDGCEPVTCVFSCHGDGDCGDGHPCTNDRCDVSAHVCMHTIAADGRVCRPPAGPCDAEETCDGAGPDCPADGLEPEGTACDDGDPCTYPDECTAGGLCEGSPSGLHDVAAAAPGKEHTCVLMTTGGVKCWGRNDKGQLGDGTGSDSSVPVDVSGLSSGVVSLCSGEKHTCAVLAGGGVKCWGLNDKGQLGDGTTTDRASPVNVSGMSSGIAVVEGGGKHTCAVTAAGAVKCWGLNDRGQVGDATTTDRLTPVDVSGVSSGAAGVSCGDKHTCAVFSAGGVKCWGLNDKGQVGDATTTDRLTPVDVSGLTTGAAGVSCGEKHSCALLTAGGESCWGLNDVGQLGDGTTTDSLTPIAVTGLASSAVDAACGYGHTCAVLDTGGIVCWGNNNRSQLGDGTNTDRSVPVDVVCP